MSKLASCLLSLLAALSAAAAAEPGDLLRYESREPSPAATNQPPRRVPLPAMTAILMASQFALVDFHEDDEDWTDEGHHFRDGFRRAPVWDDDDAGYNYVLHPWVGSEYYLVARNRGWSAGGSVLYSAALSTFYEYGPENLIQQPSANDLLITPLVGSVVGEARFRLKQRLLDSRRPIRGGRALAALIDPMDAAFTRHNDGEALLLRWRRAF